MRRSSSGRPRTMSYESTGPLRPRGGASAVDEELNVKELDAVLPTSSPTSRARSASTSTPTGTTARVRASSSASTRPRSPPDTHTHFQEMFPNPKLSPLPPKGPHVRPTPPKSLSRERGGAGRRRSNSEGPRAGVLRGRDGAGEGAAQVNEGAGVREERLKAEASDLPPPELSRRPPSEPLLLPEFRYCRYRSPVYIPSFTLNTALFFQVFRAGRKDGRFEIASPVLFLPLLPARAAPLLGTARAGVNYY